MIALRLEGMAGTRLAPALSRLGHVTFARSRGSSYAQVSAAQAREAIRAFALVGIACGPCDEDLAPRPGILRARGLDLSPLPSGTVDLDIVRIDRLPLGAATREVLRPRLCGLLPPSAASRARCRALLRGDDVIFGWSRESWASRAVLRARPIRRVLRPVVFDPSPQSAQSGRITSTDEHLAAWLFA